MDHIKEAEDIISVPGTDPNFNQNELDYIRQHPLPEMERDSSAVLEQNKIYKSEDARRANRLKEMVSWVVNLGLACLAILFFSVLAIRAWDVIAPSHLRWLSTEQTDKIDNLTLIILSGTVASFASSYFKGIFGFNSEKKQ